MGQRSEDADGRPSVDVRRSEADVAELLAPVGIDREEIEVLGRRFLFRSFISIILDPRQVDVAEQLKLSLVLSRRRV